MIERGDWKMLSLAPFAKYNYKYTSIPRPRPGINNFAYNIQLKSLQIAFQSDTKLIFRDNLNNYYFSNK